jgi:hypothetical protein
MPSGDIFGDTKAIGKKRLDISSSTLFTITQSPPPSFCIYKVAAIATTEFSKCCKSHN